MKIAYLYISLILCLTVIAVEANRMLLNLFMAGKILMILNNVVDQLADAPQNFIQTIMKRFQRFRMQLSNFMLPQIQLKFKTRQGMDNKNMSMGSSEEGDDSKEKMRKMYERFCKPPYLKKSKRIKCKTTW